MSRGLATIPQNRRSDRAKTLIDNLSADDFLIAELKQPQAKAGSACRMKELNFFSVHSPPLIWRGMGLLLPENLTFTI
jgi:hypothetical protein